ncbi:hypothetical protein A3Q56_00660 [Intoshia linei]|uniref:SH3 domain-containing protein n=1 Tax=Intoshia linei TaxID=1819745 RepID=A0A177BD35_9BILA|nr:hypothetical protein A3Q56_00660 [Intoshia linei]
MSSIKVHASEDDICFSNFELDNLKSLYKFKLNSDNLNVARTKYDSKSPSKSSDDSIKNKCKNYMVKHVSTFCFSKMDADFNDSDTKNKLKTIKEKNGILTMECIMKLEIDCIQIVTNSEVLSTIYYDQLINTKVVSNTRKLGFSSDLICLYVANEEQVYFCSYEVHVFEPLSIKTSKIMRKIKKFKKEYTNINLRNKINDNDRHDIQNTDIIQYQSVKVESDSALDQSRNVLLNNCLHDIDVFVKRIQSSINSYGKLLEYQKCDYKRLTSRTVSALAFNAIPPNITDFTFIFQKMKLAFLLLTKLLCKIRKPNVPEIANYMMKPFQLIVQVSSHLGKGENVYSKIDCPSLNNETIMLLNSCLHSDEYKFWQSLDKNWTSVIPTNKKYIPLFFNGYAPKLELVQNAIGNSIDTISQLGFTKYEDKNFTLPLNSFFSCNSLTSLETNSKYDSSSKSTESNASNKNFKESQLKFISKLRKDNYRVFYTVCSWIPQNNKELSVKKNESLKLIDNSRNWWKMENYNGVPGYLPKTILKIAH